ncbi:MAG: LURP-one-related family protein [Streptococcaceae bacterium]|nr:LURP-one-related family protein [Streptococcaceae bacterium]
MAEYFVQQKALSSNRRTLVQDENGKNIYLLVGRWGKCHDKVSLYDLDGHLLGFIRQTSVISGGRFSLYKGLEKVATMQKIPTLKKDRYFLSKLNWIASGNFSEHRYEIKHGYTLIMQMLGTHMLRGDFYSLVIPEKENAPLAILISAVLDYWLYNSKPQKTFSLKNYTRQILKFNSLLARKQSK